MADDWVDILNRLNPTSKPTCAGSSWVDPDPRKQAENSRHLAKYVFARQYGLPNVFVVNTRRPDVLQLPDYLDREHQIKVGS